MENRPSIPIPHGPDLFANMFSRLLLLLLLAVAFDVGSEASFSFDAPESDISHVEVVEGFNASLPCALHSPPQDEPVLTLWYFGSDEAPVYSYDQRSGRDPETWSDARRIGNRALYLAHEFPPVLVLFNVTSSDARTYRCRVDYKLSNSKVAHTKLSVVVPPNNIHLRVIKDTVEEGQSNDVVCSGSGGSPSSRVVWLQGGSVVDTNYSDRNGMTANTLEAPATRNDALSPFTCRVSNNDVTVPLTKIFYRNVTAGPLNVSITLEEEPLVAGRRAKLRCAVEGSNPVPRVRWFRDAVELPEDRAEIRQLGNLTISTLAMNIAESDNGGKLTCRAENLLLPTATLEETYTLNVAYKPNVSLALGWSLKPQDLKEGNDAFFECRIDANPPPYKVTWIHEGRELEQNVSAGVLASETTLALQRVDRRQSGAYQCKASNVEGDSISNFVNISIKYTPRCAVPPSLRGVALSEPTTIRCAVDADPVNVSFKWTFNNSARKDASETLPDKKFTTNGLESVLYYTPHSERDYGTLLCYASNVVGMQDSPCSFTVISAGPPEDVTDCIVDNITSHSAGVTCNPGFDGGLPQRYLLQVWEMVTGKLVLNVTSARPSFIAHPLEPGLTYKAVILSYNSRGSTEPTRLLFLTLKEVAMHKSLPSMVEPSPIVWVLGVVGGVLVVVGAMLIAVWWVRARDRRSGGMGGATKTVTHIVSKENNPDLLSMDNTEDSDGDDPPSGLGGGSSLPLRGGTDLIGDTSLDFTRDLEAGRGAGPGVTAPNLAVMRMGRGREDAPRGLNGSMQQQQHVQYNPSHQPHLMEYTPGIRSYGRFEDDSASMYVSSSPDVNERTRLTTAVASPATSSRSSRIALDESGHPMDPSGGSIGGIGGSLLRGSKGGRMADHSNATELDHRRQTTVRLLRSGSPESAC